MENEMNVNDMARKYGTVTHNGTKYTLTEQATLSNRVFPGWWGDANEGEEYTAEYHASATINGEDDYLVYWQFDVIKGQEEEDESNYPWDAAHVSKVVMQ